MKIGPNSPCPCGSGSKFKRCCRPVHQGTAAASPEALMRARFSAYATGAVDFILSTTHPEGPHFEADAAGWRASVRSFCASTEFQGLEVLEASESAEAGEVAFRVTLVQAGEDASFGERSTFRKVAERWLYHSGELL
ncbi:MAG: SEC-C domain-containing protein [Planctomycetes bacterium]|nr:SEC-C domain-containing protein [Planctomycetota bacterium]